MEQKNYMRGYKELVPDWAQLEEYSEEPETLKEVMKVLKVGLKFLRFAPYFDDDKQSRNIYSVCLFRTDKNSAVYFKFGDSIANAQEGKEPDVYSILACVGSDYWTPDTFKEFCGEYGYNEDSRKAEKLFKVCRQQAEKIQSIFTEEEAQSLPR